MMRHINVRTRGIAPLGLLALALLLATVVPVRTERAHAASPLGWEYKGFTMAPYSQDELGSSNTATTLQQLARAGANAVTFAVSWYTDNVYSANIYRTGNTASDASLITAMQEARSLGLKIMVKPHVDSLDGQWRAHIHPCSVTNAEPCPAANDLASTWFANYTAIVDHYADIAQQQGAASLCIGAELIDLSTNPTYTNQWRTLIAGVRGRFSGKLTYSANWGSGSFATEYTRVPFWDALDYIGISAYFPLAMTNTPTVDGMRATWVNTVQPQIAAVQQQWGKPILFTEGGYRSADGTAQAPFDSWDNWPLDAQEQADCYEATFEAWANVPWFAGTAFWYWSSNPNFSSTDTDYPVQNKAAYNTVASWFSAAAPPPANCPTGWGCGDIGGPVLAGGQSVSAGTWTVQGAGGDIWSVSDQFHYVWQSLAGDGSVGGRVLSQTNTDVWAKAGFMLRQSTDAGAPYYAVLMTPGNGVNVQYRPAQGANAVQLLSTGGTSPAYLKVGRTGNTFTAYTAGDGATWTPIPGSSVALTLGGALLAGMAVTSHNPGISSVATFDTVGVAAAGAGTPATATAQPTSTPTATSTPRPTSTPTATSTPRLTSTPTATATSQPVSTVTSQATSTASATATPPTIPMATATTPAANGGSSAASGSVTAGSGSYWSEEDVKLTNSASLTALRIVVTVQKTSGSAYAGQYNTVSSTALAMSYSDSGSQIVYTYTLTTGQTVPAGSGWLFGAQFSGTGVAHAYSGDTYTMTATAGSVTSTTTGHF